MVKLKMDITSKKIGSALFKPTKTISFVQDFTGQLDILDHLGKMLYDQGDAEGSRQCYEQRLAIETQMNKA